MQFRAEVVDDGIGNTLRLAGRLECEHSSELVDLYEHTDGAVRLDLADLVSADAAGLNTLRMLRGRGAELVGLSPYLTLRLGAESSESTQSETRIVTGTGRPARVEGHTLHKKEAR